MIGVSGGLDSTHALIVATRAIDRLGLPRGNVLGYTMPGFATSELTPQVVGTPAGVADQLTDLFEAKACDGFILTPTVFPGTWEQFVRSVVPELQRRGVFRTEYRGRTLRENLRD